MPMSSTFSAFFSNRRLRIKIPNKPKKIQIYVDYDDTTFPTTSFLLAKIKLENQRKKVSTDDCLAGLKVICSEEKVNITDYDDKLYKFLKMLMEIGNVSFITLSEEGWPLVSCGGLFPKTSLLLNSDIPIIHALGFRQDKEEINLQLLEVLKYRAMRSCLSDDTELVVSIGDSGAEVKSAWRLKEESLVPRVLTVKLKEHPSSLDLIETLECLYQCFPHFIEVVSGNNDYVKLTLILKGEEEIQNFRRRTADNEFDARIEESLKYVLQDDYEVGNPAPQKNNQSDAITGIPLKYVLKDNYFEQGVQTVDARIDGANTCFRKCVLKDDYHESNPQIGNIPSDR